MIWEELGTKFKILFEMGKSGVVAALLAASQRLQIHEHEVYNSLIFLFLCLLEFTFLYPVNVNIIYEDFYLIK